MADYLLFELNRPGQGSLKSRRENDQSSPSGTNESSGHLTNEERSYGVTPSPASGNATAPPLIRKTSSIAQGGVMPQEVAQTTQGLDPKNAYGINNDYRQDDHQNHIQQHMPRRPVMTLEHSKSNGSDRVRGEVEPYFAGKQARALEGPDLISAIMSIGMALMCYRRIRRT